jgi:hypothetical protein
MNISLPNIKKSIASLLLILTISLNSWGQSSFTYGTPLSGINEPAYMEAEISEFQEAIGNLSLKDSMSAVNISKSGSKNENLKIYPNPSDGIFTIELNKTESNKVSIEILDITGKLVYINDYPVMGTLKEIIDLQNLNKGMYFLRVKEEEKISTVKIIFR